MENYTDYNILIPYNKKSGEVKVICPKCPPHKHQNDHSKDLTVYLDTNSWYCFRCGFKGKLHDKKPDKIQKDFKKPIWHNKTELSEKVVKWFESRGISQNTLIQMKITESLEYMPQIQKEVNCINFNYFRDSELINIKFRDSQKNFKLFSGAELILYNLDSIKDSKVCVITEGEIDCLTYIEAGIDFVCSVPNGANKVTNNLQYIDNCFEYFDNKEKIYIATDDDENGRKLQNDLIQRFGAERCYIVTYDGCKDINEFKQKNINNDLVLSTIEKAKEIKIEGLFKVIDIEPELDDIYLNGLQRGLNLGFTKLDEIISWTFGAVAIVTGIPGHGKSEVIDEILVRLNILHGIKACYFSPENFPLQLHAAKIVSKLTGKEFNKDSMSYDEYFEAKQHLQDNFSFIYPKDEAYSLDNILQKAEYSIKKEGCKILIIDPWNRLEHQITGGQSETNYISKQLDKLTNFAQKRNVLIFLMAHPRKMQKMSSGLYEVPNLYDINGSANFFNKAFYGLTVYRIFDNENPLVQLHIQKVKFKHLGTVGMQEFKYNSINGRLSEYNELEPVYYDYDNYLRKNITVQIPF